MKLHDLKEDDSAKEEIYQWFVDNNIKLISRDARIASSWAKNMSKRGFLDCLDDPNVTIGSVLNFSKHGALLPTDSPLTSPAPFKFGTLYALHAYYVNDLSKLDLSSLNVFPNALEITFDKTGGDVTKVAKSLRHANYVNLTIDVNLVPTDQMRNIVGMIHALQLLSEHAKASQTTVIDLPDSDDTGAETSIFVDDGGFYSIWQTRPHTTKQYTTLSKMTIMDLQEWLFDNGYEDLL